MSTASEDVSEGKLLLVEYDQVKGEQRARITHRDGLVYTTIAAMAGVIAAVISAKTTALLLVLPPVSVLLGWTYLTNDEKVSAAGRYVRERIGPRLEALANASEPVFGWEVAHRNGPRRRARKLMQLVVDLVAFCAAPAAALVTFWVLGPVPTGLIIVSVAESLLVAALAAFVVLEADLRKPAAVGTVPAPDGDVEQAGPPR
jgi:hypothetical protein